MARNVKISTIGGPDFYLAVDAKLPYADMWDKVKAHLAKQIDQVLPDKPDLIVLTEMCDLPMEFPSSEMKDFVKGYVDSRGADNLRFFGRVARENHCNISFSTVTRGEGDYYMNTTFLLNRDGSVAGQYDKYYVTYGEYTWNIRYGIETPLISMDFGKVACAICFDLNFDDLRERYVRLKPDLIIFASMFHGGLMQQVWANTCRSYFVGAIAHQRPSSILSPLGETLAYTADYLNYVTTTVNLDYAFAHLREKKQLLELKKRYGAGVTLYDPCYIGYFMLTSELPDKSVEEMIKEFNIVTYDDYIIESRALRNTPGNQGASAKCAREESCG
jgi:hypothetical protein